MVALRYFLAILDERTVCNQEHAYASLTFDAHVRNHQCNPYTMYTSLARGARAGPRARARAPAGAGPPPARPPPAAPAPAPPLFPRSRG